MTPEQLESYIATADAEGLAEAVQSLTETERSKLSKAAAAAYKKWNKARETLPSVIRLTREEIKDATTFHHRLRQATDKREALNSCCSVARLALFALCPITALRHIEGFWRHDPLQELLVQIIIDRKPGWAQQWVDRQLEENWPAMTWQQVQRLVDAGAIERSTSDPWIRSMVNDLPDRCRDMKDNPEQYVPISDKLKQRPELLCCEIWRLFEVETQAFFRGWYFENQDRPANFETWSVALRRLADEGAIDRQRLIDGALSGLTAGFTNRDTLSHYMKFHDFLEPANEELLAHQRKYLDLLSHSASHVVSFALGHLKSINKFKHFDDAAFTAACNPLITSRVKNQAKTTLSLLKQIFKRSPQLRPSIIRTAMNGLRHESTDVQEQTIACLDEWLDGNDTESNAMLKDALPSISASIRPKAEELLKKAGLQSETDHRQIKRKDLTAPPDQLYERMQSLNPRVLQLAGADGVREAIENGIEYPPLDFDMYDVPILSGLDPITPIQTVDELLEAVAHAVEHVDSADEVEKILDAISRLCNDRYDGFETRATPLLKRIIDITDSAAPDGLVTSYGGPIRLYPLLCAWLCGEAEFATPRHYANNPSPVFIMDERLHELGLRVLRHEAAPLLAAPTHERGWIDPRVFVRRLLDQQENEMDVLRYDFTQALLRLAPDHRAEALNNAPSINGVIGDIVRWALGDDKLPDKLLHDHAGPWIAAARARTPNACFESLRQFDSFGDYPDTIFPVVYQWRASTSEEYNKWSKTTSTIPRLDISNGLRKLQQKVAADVPTSLLHIQDHSNKYEIHYGYRVHRPWLVNWCQMIWPQNTDAFCAAAVREMMARIEKDASVYDPNFAYFEVFFEPDRPLTEMSTLMLWLGLVGKDADVRAHAAEALAETIHDGRAHPEPLSAVLIKLAAGGWLKLNRLSAALADVARLSPLHQLVIARTLTRWLAAQNDVPRDGHHILALLLELQTALGLPLPDNARRPLEPITGQSKTATLARRLLKLNPTGPSPAFTQANLLQLQARIDRAERWQ